MITHDTRYGNKRRRLSSNDVHDEDEDDHDEEEREGEGEGYIDYGDDSIYIYGDGEEDEEDEEDEDAFRCSSLMTRDEAQGCVKCGNWKI